MTDKIKKFNFANKLLTEKLGRKPNDYEICDFLKLTEKQLQKIKNSIILDPISLETAVTEDLNIADFIEDTNSASPEDCVGDECLKSSLPQLLNVLTPREKEVIVQRFGIDGNPSRTLLDVGTNLGYSKERIRQIECGALAKMRNNIYTKHFKDFIKD